MTVILDQFIHTLVESGLMTAEEIGNFVDGFPAEDRPTDGEGLAKLLFLKNKLTPSSKSSASTRARPRG